MGMLIAGLVLFLGMHLLPVVPALRNSLVAGLGENGYKGLFSIVSLVGLVLIVWGFARAPYIHVYAPVPGARHAAMTAMPIVFVLLAAANMPSHIRSKLKHPMLIAVLLWSAVHLMANGDLRSLVLFGSFGVYALVDLVSEIARGKTLIGAKPPSWKMDLIALVSGLVLFAVVMRFHGALFGVPILH